MAGAENLDLFDFPSISTAVMIKYVPFIISARKHREELHTQIMLCQKPAYWSYIHLSPSVLVDKAPSYRLGEIKVETGEVLAVWSILFDSASWHLAIAGHTRSSGTVSPSLGTWQHSKLQSIWRTGQDRGGQVVGP